MTSFFQNPWVVGISTSIIGGIFILLLSSLISLTKKKEEQGGKHYEAKNPLLSVFKVRQRDSSELSAYDIEENFVTKFLTIIYVSAQEVIAIAYSLISFPKWLMLTLSVLLTVISVISIIYIFKSKIPNDKYKLLLILSNISGNIYVFSLVKHLF